jgi:hypothetical protein
MTTATTRPRRPLLKRACPWTSAVVLSLAGYLAGAPFVILYTFIRFRPAHGVARAVYFPAEQFRDTASLPGSALYSSYFNTCSEWTMDQLVPGWREI